MPTRGAAAAAAAALVLITLLQAGEACTAGAQPPVQPFSWASWGPAQRDRRLLAHPGAPSVAPYTGRAGLPPRLLLDTGGASDNSSAADQQQQQQQQDDDLTLGLKHSRDGYGVGGYGNGSNAASGGNSTGAALADTTQADPAQGGSSCPTITIVLRAMQVLHPLVDVPGAEILFQCQTNTGRRYRLYEIPVDIAFEHQPGDAKLSLQLAAAQLKCGEAMSCRVVGQWPQANGQAAAVPLFDWISSGCWFQYWHFTSTQQQSPLWSCRDENAGEYVLQCADCPSSSSSAAPFSSSGSSGRGSSINPSIIIIVICVCSGTAIAVGLALLVRHRRRTRSMNARIAELLQRAEGRERGPPPDFKPPPLYELELYGLEEEDGGGWGWGIAAAPAGGEIAAAGPATVAAGSEQPAAVEPTPAGAEAAGQAPADSPSGSNSGGGTAGGEEAAANEAPRQRLPPPGYRGPIVVLNPHDNSEGPTENLPARGALLLARPDFSGASGEGDEYGDAAARRRLRRHRRRAHMYLPAPPPLYLADGQPGSGGGRGSAGEGAPRGASSTDELVALPPTLAAILAQAAAERRRRRAAERAALADGAREVPLQDLSSDSTGSRRAGAAAAAEASLAAPQEGACEVVACDAHASAGAEAGSAVGDVEPPADAAAKQGGDA